MKLMLTASPLAMEASCTKVEIEPSTLPTLLLGMNPALMEKALDVISNGEGVKSGRTQFSTMTMSTSQLWSMPLSCPRKK